MDAGAGVTGVGGKGRGGTVAGARWARLTLLVVTAVVLYGMATMPLNDLPAKARPWLKDIFHLFGPAVLSLLIWVNLPRHWAGRRRHLAAAAVTFLLGSMVELVQAYALPHRSGRVADLWLNLTAIAIAQSGLSCLRSAQAMAGALLPQRPQDTNPFRRHQLRRTASLTVMGLAVAVLVGWLVPRLTGP